MQIFLLQKTAGNNLNLKNVKRKMELNCPTKTLPHCPWKNTL